MAASGTRELLREFRPTILFLIKFIGIYLVGNVLYGLYVTAYDPAPDPATRWVTLQTARALDIAGWPATTADYAHKPTTIILHEGRGIVSVYEGCNGLNVMVIFMGFVLAFGPMRKAMWWFIPLGILLIHLSNLLRIGLLFLVTLYFPRTLYFAHKYLFTAFIFLIVFGLWIWWVRKFTNKTGDAK